MMVAYTCHPSHLEAEAGGSQVRGQPEQLSKTLTQNKNKTDFLKGLGALLSGRALV
jgi:hypothetical protein